MKKCDICLVLYTSSDDEKAHLSGRRHLKAQKALDAQTSSLDVNSNGIQSYSDTNRCLLCNVLYTSDVTKREHENGKKHTTLFLRSRSVHTAENPYAPQELSQSLPNLPEETINPSSLENISTTNVLPQTSRECPPTPPNNSIQQYQYPLLI